MLPANSPNYTKWFEYPQNGSHRRDTFINYQKKISTMMERKYNVKVHESSLILFPVWECTLSLKKEQKTRKIVLDAILGNEVRFD